MHTELNAVNMLFTEDLFTRKSVSGYTSHKNKGAITWGAKGQGKVALSSSDAELRALAECMCECNWLRKWDDVCFMSSGSMRGDLLLDPISRRCGVEFV